MSTNPEIKTIDDLQQRLEEAGSAAKEKLIQLKNAAEETKLVMLQDFLSDFVIEKGVDGFVTLKNKLDQSEYRVASEETLETIFQDTLKGIAELKIYESLHQVKVESISTSTKQEAANLQQSVNNGKVEKQEKGVKYEYDSRTGISTFNFKDWLVLKEADAGHAVIMDPSNHVESRQARQLKRRVNRHMELQNENKKAKKLEKDARKAAELNESLSRQRDALASTTIDTFGAAEKRKQTQYYEQVINLAIAEFQSKNYQKEDIVYVDSYIPLFTVDAINPTGRVGIRLSPDDVAAFAATNSSNSLEMVKERMHRGEASEAEITQYYKMYPESKEQEGGLIGGLVDGIIDHSNMTPEQGQKLKSAAKIGALIGLGILGWKTIKKIFTGKDGEGWKWGLGAAAILVGVPALTGKGVWELLTKGDAKDSWNNIKGLLEKNGIEIGNIFESTDRKVIYPALGNRMFGDLNIEELKGFTVMQNGKKVFKEKDYMNYLEQKALAETDPVKQEVYKNKIALFKSTVEQKQTQVIFDSYASSIQLDKVTNAQEKCQVAYESYINGQLLGSRLLEGNKQMKIADQGKFELYVYEQTVVNHRNPSTITKEELQKNGLLVEVATEDKSKTNKNEKKEKSTTEQAQEKLEKGWDEFTDWTADAWKKMKGALAATSATVVGWFDTKEKPPVTELDRQKAQLKRMKERLAELEKMDATKQKQVTTAEEIKQVKDSIKDSEYKLNQIEVMGKEDPVLRGMVDKKLLDKSVATQLTDAKNELNTTFELIDREDQHKLIHFVEKDGQLYVASYNEQMPVKIIMNADNKTFTAALSDCPLQFNTAKDLLQVANLTNFLVMNYQYSSKEANPFYVDGDEISMSGPGIDKDMLEHLYTDIGQPRTGKFVDWLNNKKGSMGVSIWLETGKPNNDLMKLKSELSKGAVNLPTMNAITPTLSGQYEGQSISLQDVSSTWKNANGVITGYGKLEASYDGHAIVYKTHGRETAISKDGNAFKVADFRYTFESPTEALYVANLVNYCKKYYEYSTTGKEPFNMSYTGEYLEFAQQSDNDFFWSWVAKTDNRVATKSQLTSLSPIFNNEKIREEFAKFLNKSYDKWHG